MVEFHHFPVQHILGKLFFSPIVLFVLLIKSLILSHILSSTYPYKLRFLVFISILQRSIMYRRQRFIHSIRKDAMYIHALNSVRRKYNGTVTIIVTIAVIKPNTTH